MSRDAAIDRLRAARPRHRFARWSAVAMAVLVAAAWIFGDLELARLFSARSAANLQRFLGELRPYPLWGKAWDWGVAFAWARTTLRDAGVEAMLATLALSVAAICLAGVAGALFSLPAARTLATAEPYLPGPRRPGPARRGAWRALVAVTRLGLIFVRAIPEYVWGFLLLTLIGPGAWPAVLALAIHNTGILGKLDAEVLENLPPATPRALRAMGASRLQVAVAALFPAALGRFLLYFFYRWETCVREATVLGLLGFMGIGWYVLQARSGVRYDELFLFVLLGSAIILAGDLVSALARGLVRRS